MDKFTARRRLLRGSLSAPLVLTVASSPAAAAARGSWEACLYRAGKNPATEQAFRFEHDTWLRQRVDIYSFTPAPTSTAAPTSSPTPPGTESTEQLSAPSADTVASVDGTDSGVASTQEACKVLSPGDYYELEGRYYPVPSDTEEAGASPLSCHPGHSAEDFCGGALERTNRSGLVLVYVNDSGAIVGYGPCPPEGSFPVSGSCWASFGGMQGVG